MLSINVKLTLMALIPLPFVALYFKKIWEKTTNTKKFMRVQKCFSKLTDLVQEKFFWH